MKNSFTIVELIFVIVILGALATVALPRYFGIEQQAQANISKAFAATLTRTVGHSLWSKSISMGAHGSIKSDNDGDSSKFYGRSLEVYVTIPKYFDKTSVNFDNCVHEGEVASPFIQKDGNVGGEYNIFCRDGNATDAPRFVASKEESYTF